MCKNIKNCTTPNYTPCHNAYSQDKLDAVISTSEIMKAVSALKNKKASGLDGITNEVIKTSMPELVQCYRQLFNRILLNGQFPDCWRNNLIKPLHKGGDSSDPSNYRGIAMSSCLSKLFCKIMDSRLQAYLEEYDIINRCQIGFRPKFRTSDHILVLTSIINKFVSKKKYLFTCFIDLKKAFDTVWRDGMFLKLKMYGITGKVLNVITDMYKEVKYNIKLKDGYTESFSTSVGVKQGCILSPKLFNIYINDLSSIFDESCDPVNINDYKLSCLMYADDIVLMSSSAEGLQVAINKLQLYLSEWHLELNTSESKIIIFNKSGRKLKQYKFFFNKQDLEIVTDYRYLGPVIKASGNIDIKKNLSHKGMKALFAMKQKLS